MTDIDVAVGDTTNDNPYFVSQGLTHAYISSARVGWVCLTESMTDTDLREMIRDWFLPRSIATIVKWSDAFDAVNM